VIICRLVLIIYLVKSRLAFKDIENEGQLRVARYDLMIKLSVSGGATVGVEGRALQLDGLLGVHVYEGDVPTLSHMELSNFEHSWLFLLILSRIFELLAICVKCFPVDGGPVLSITPLATLLQHLTIKHLDILHRILNGLGAIVLHVRRIREDVEWM
jgi:hypothetical protein